jgi:hypothetical protein
MATKDNKQQTPGAPPLFSGVCAYITPDRSCTLLFRDASDLSSSEKKE